MKISKRFLISLVLMVSAGFIAHGRQTLAVASPGGGLTVSPAFQMVTISGGAETQPVSFKLTNNQNTPQTLNLSVEDFNSLNESGGLFFVGTNPTQLQKKYGLASWFSLPQDQITIQPKQTMTISGDVLNLSTLSPGGHYGALMISIGGQNPNPGQIGIHPIASSLLFVTKPQGATHNLALSNVYINHGLFKLPTSVTLRFHNDGNTHVVPRGVVSLLTKNGRLISKGVINENSNIILPQNFRRYSIDLKTVSAAGIGGAYTLKTDFRFDGIDIYRSYKTSFYYISVYALIFVIILLAAILFLKFRPKNFEKRIVNKAKKASQPRKK